MNKEPKKHPINFRISEKSYKWLELLTNGISTSTYFNDLIQSEIIELICKKALNEAKAIVAKEFGVSAKIYEAIKGPDYLRGLAWSIEREELFANKWMEEMKKNLEEKFKEHDFDIEINQLSAEKWQKAIEYVFVSYPDIKSFQSVIFEMPNFEKKGRSKNYA